MKRLFLSTILAAIISSYTAAWSLPAFPGAEGFGSHTIGGRGGRVIGVTNLNDKGPGSLRSACEAEGPRIVVFRVGGTIRLESHLEIKKPFVTIAGQTAPGGGILLRNAGLHISTHDVVVRYLRVRIGESRVENAGSQDALHLGEGKRDNKAYNIVIDHCSFSWAIDENGDSWGDVRDFTVQNCTFSEALKKSIHHKGEHSMGFLMGRESSNSSLHHNLFAHNNGRNPRIQGGRRDIVNNLFYNWGSTPAMFTHDPEVNFVANYFKRGPNSGTKDVIISGENTGKIYLKGTFLDQATNLDWDYVHKDAGAVKADTRFHAPLVTTWPASELPDRLLSNVGCSYPKRDSVDERIIGEVRQGKGRIIDHPDQVGGFPTIENGTPLPDRDHDGMPDDWETANNLNPDDPSDASKDRDGDGYTNVEEWVNGIGEHEGDG